MLAKEKLQLSTDTNIAPKQPIFAAVRPSTSPSGGMLELARRSLTNTAHGRKQKAATLASEVSSIAHGTKRKAATLASTSTSPRAPVSKKPRDAGVTGGREPIPFIGKYI